jgi:hypothetical protein
MWTGDAIYGVEFPPVLVYQPAKTSLADDQTISRRQGHGNGPERLGYVQFALMIPLMGSGLPRSVHDLCSHVSAIAHVGGPNLLTRVGHLPALLGEYPKDLT